jgi:hypothetical protein
MRIAHDLSREGLFAQRGSDAAHNGANIWHDLVCSKANDTEIITGEPGSAPRIKCRLAVFAMLAAVYLNHEPRGQADEIRKIRPDRILAAKAQTVQPFLSQKSPEFLFRIRCGCAELPGMECPPPPNNRWARLFAPSRKGRGRVPARTLAVSGHYSNTAPRPVIKSWYSGKDVAIMVTSSTVTGFCAANPIVKKLMAMR